MKKYISIWFFIFILSYLSYAQPTKKVMLEEFTAAWSGWDTRGLSLRDSLVNALPNSLISVCYHIGDPMDNAQGSAIQSQFNVSAVPTAMIDRKLFNGQSAVPVNTQFWNSYVVTRLSQAPILGITLETDYNTQTRMSYVEVKIKFSQAQTANMKVHLLYVEDSVFSSASSYNQYNNYGNGCTFPDPTNAYYSYPCIINQFKHRDVFRYAATPVLGQSGIIPGTVAAGDSFLVNYAYSVPSGYDEDKMHLVAFVSTTDNSVLNAERVPLYSCNCMLNASTVITHVSGLGCTNGKIKVNINGVINSYPRFELYDAQSNLVAFFDAPQNTTSYTFTNLAPGTYTVQVKDSTSCCLVTLTNKKVKCQAPSLGLMTNSITTTSAVVNWSAVSCASGYRVQYRKSGNSSWTTKGGTALSKLLTGLQPSSIYEWRVASLCSGSNPSVYSIYSALQTFTTNGLRAGETISDEVIETESINISLIPNPATENILIDFECEAKRAIIKVINANGQVVMEQELNPTDDNCEKLLNISALASGMYSVSIAVADKIGTKRFIKE